MKHIRIFENEGSGLDQYKQDFVRQYYDDGSDTWRAELTKDLVANFLISKGADLTILDELFNCLKEIGTNESKNSSETGDYPAPKFAIRPAAGDTGYDMVAKEFGAPASPKKKKKNSNTQEVKEMNNLKTYDEITEGVLNFFKGDKKTGDSLVDIITKEENNFDEYLKKMEKTVRTETQKDSKKYKPEMIKTFEEQALRMVSNMMIRKIRASK